MKTFNLHTFATLLRFSLFQELCVLYIDHWKGAKGLRGVVLQRL